MEGIATILGEPYYSLVEGIWREMHDICGLAEIKSTDIPHFSWHVAESYAENKLADLLSEAVKRAKPFRVQTTGLGIFTGEKSVLYLALVKDPAFMQFHQELWELLSGLGKGINHYYAPEYWVPHITLAYEGVDAVKLSCAIRRLVERSLYWTIQVDNLAIIGQNGLKNGRGVLRFPFEGVEE